MNKKLIELGLNDEIFKEFESKYGGLYLGRVIAEYKGLYKVATEEDVLLSNVSGKIIYNAIDKSSYPAVGDWVAIDRKNNDEGNGIINGVLDRRSKISRKVAGQEIDEQVIASNINTIFICMSANNDFNLRRLERYISIAWNSGALPVVVLTKEDLCGEIDVLIGKVKEVAIGIDIVCVSSLTGKGIGDVYKYIRPGETVVFIGSSGVGKSSLINSIIGEERLKVNDIRADDDKGKHTTTNRELIVLPEGGIVIDTPGMREIQILDDVDDIDDTFSDIVELSKKCKFSDCKHKTEPGCAIKAAVQSGQLSLKRLENYNKLKKEAEYISRKLDMKAQSENKKKWININKEIRANKKRIQY